MKRDENYLLFVPSLLSKTQTISYQAGENKEKYMGKQTNEAVTKYLIDYISSKGGKLDKIIMLCSQEVREEQLEQIGGQTTLEYYKSEILAFIRERGLEEEENLFEMIPYILRNDGEPEEITEPLMRVLQIAGEDREQGKKHLFVDFTGGIRSSALLLLFACRILQKSGVTVEKILYSQIFPKTSEGVVEECTRTYQLFGYLEAAVEGKAGGTEKMLEYANSLNDTEKKQVEKVLKKQKELKEAQRQNQIEKVKEAAKELNMALENEVAAGGSAEKIRIMKTFVDNSGKEAKNIVSRGRFPELGMIENHIKKGEYEKALNLFREKIVRILYEAEVLKVSDRLLDKDKKGKKPSLKEKAVVNELMGVYYYYENPISDSFGSRHTFMDAIRAYIGQLSSNPAREPEEVLRECMGDSFYDLGNYLKDVPKKGFAHTEYSRKAAMEKVVPCLEKYHKNGNDMRQFLEEYTQMDKVYMGYGFPFACTYDGWFLNGYDKEYQRNLKNGVRSLQNLYLGKKDVIIQKIHEKCSGEDFTYEMLVWKLNKKEESKLLRMLFPYRLLERNISCGKVMKKEKWEEFMYDFVKSFYLIKNARNKIMHAGKLEAGGEKQAVEEVKKVISILENYIS